jgi:hypothetical protein
VTLYEVLGVRPGASADEIRRVYVHLARRNHPDFHRDDTPDTRRAAERRMQRINEAWHVLGDRDRRAAYDLELVHSDEGVVRDVPTRVWTPIDDDVDEAEIDPRELIDDRPIGDGSRPPRALTLAPAVFFAVTVASFAVGMVVRLPFLFALAVGALLLTFLSLLAAPAVALAKSWQSERAAGA